MGGGLRRVAGRAAALIAAAAALAAPFVALGNTTADEALAARAKDPPAFDAAFNVGFDKNVKDGCMSTAAKKASADIADSYCTCIVVELDKLSVPDRITLADHPEREKVAVDACNARIAPH